MSGHESKSSMQLAAGAGAQPGALLRSDPLVTLLLDRGLITAEGLERLQHLSGQTQTQLSAALTHLGLVSEPALAYAGNPSLRGVIPEQT